MPKWVEGDRVKVVSRTVTEDDRKRNVYFEHMAGLIGQIQAVYSESEVAIKVETGSMGPITTDVHQTATKRMFDKFISGLSEEAKRGLTKEELDFQTNYVLLVQGTDLEKA